MFALLQLTPIAFLYESVKFVFHEKYIVMCFARMVKK